MGSVPSTASSGKPQLDLDLGREQRYHELGEPRLGQAEAASHVSAVAELAGLDAGLKVVGLGQQAGDPGGVSLAQTGLAAGAALVVLLAAGPDRSFRDLRRGLGFLGLGHPVSGPIVLSKAESGERAPGLG